MSDARETAICSFTGITPISEKISRSHYKSMRIFSDAKGQLTPQSVVKTRRISSSFELSCMSLLPASMKMIG